MLFLISFFYRIFVVSVLNFDYYTIIIKEDFKKRNKAFECRIRNFASFMHEERLLFIKGMHCKQKIFIYFLYSLLLFLRGKRTMNDEDFKFVRLFLY